jgi:hypothetical protein
MRRFSYDVGFDVHRQTVSYGVKQPDGTMVGDGKVAAQRAALIEWAKGLGDSAWCGGLEATIGSHWI